MSTNIKPIVLVHGYSAEQNTKPNVESASQIYGSMPQALKQLYGKNKVIEINVSQFITLENEITVDDISYGLDKALHSPKYSHLLASGFNAIDHSTGGLVMRNWVKRYSPKPVSPLDHLIHLAPAHFGSGFANIGQGRMSKWWRKLRAGAEPGVKILQALEFGSPFSLELQKYFLDNPMISAFGIKEYAIIGSEADPSLISLPIRYAREDGADGVVRACAANVNLHYIKYVLNKENVKIDKKMWDALLHPYDESAITEECYCAQTELMPGTDKNIPQVPFMVLDKCTHSGNLGIVTGESPRARVLEAISKALSDESEKDWRGTQNLFETLTKAMYERVLTEKKPSYLSMASVSNSWDWHRQYDKYAMLILRITDQYGHPIANHDIHVDAPEEDSTDIVNTMMQHTHKNALHPHIITFYLLLDKNETTAKGTRSKAGRKTTHLLDKIGGCNITISAVQPGTNNIQYVPCKISMDKNDLKALLKPNVVTLIDLELYRVPTDEVYRIFTT